MTAVLGISCFYHDSAASLVVDGEIIAAAQEERFTRIKHDPSFPVNSITYCLEEWGKNIKDIDKLLFYDNSYLKFDRFTHTVLQRPFSRFNLWKNSASDFSRLDFSLHENLKFFFDWTGNIEFCEHHMSHAASSFFASPFNESAFLTVDGVGEWATASYGIGIENNIKILGQIDYPNSLGLLYSAFTSYCGFKVNSGEYKLMGLAPYGEPNYIEQIENKVVEIFDDGSIRLNMDLFSFTEGERMINSNFERVMGGPKRQPESNINKKYMDVARSIQVVTEKILLKMIKHVKKETEQENLCLAGGVALNCVANGKILESGLFKNLWIQPAAGDAGGSLGSALFGYYHVLNNPRKDPKGHSSQGGSYLGPSFSDQEIEAMLIDNSCIYSKVGDNRSKKIAKYIAEGKIVGHFSDRMEFGPRALGSRSILGNPTDEKTQTVMNLKIKYRESFRPFAPSVLEERINDYFDINDKSPYMLIVSQVKKERCLDFLDFKSDNIFGKLNQKRSDIPAVTHIDYSARVHSVNPQFHSKYYEIIKEFEDLTGCGVIVNTSFNVRGEPIVCTPHDAYVCFMRTEMDVLAIGNFILIKEEQPQWSDNEDWRNKFELD